MTEWFDKIKASVTLRYCANCGEDAFDEMDQVDHVEIDTRMRCCLCGRDNGQAERINMEFKEIQKQLK